MNSIVRQATRLGLSSMKKPLPLTRRGFSSMPEMKTPNCTPLKKLNVENELSQSKEVQIVREVLKRFDGSTLNNPNVSKLADAYSDVLRSEAMGNRALSGAVVIFTLGFSGWLLRP